MSKEMTLVEFDQTFRERTIDFCKDELQWHIDECEPDEYANETMAEIELLYKLGETDEAEGFARDFIDALFEKIEDYTDDAREYQEDIKLMRDQIKDVEKLMKKLKKEVK